MLQKQFGTDGGEGDDDGATVVTTSSLMLSLPAIVIDERIMIPSSEPDWLTVVMDYLNLLLNMAYATAPDDASFASQVSLRDKNDGVDENGMDLELRNDIWDEYDLSSFAETPNHDECSDDSNSEDFNFDRTMELYYLEKSSSNRDLLLLEETNNTSCNATNSCATANDSAESSVTQVTTNLTRRSSSSSRLKSLLDSPFNDSSDDVSKINEAPDGNKQKKAPLPSCTIVPTKTIQFQSQDEDSDLNDYTSFSTLSYTISNEVQRVNVAPTESHIHSSIEACTMDKRSDSCKAMNEGVNVTSRIVGIVNHQPGQRLLTIPFTKQTITVVDMTRRLMNVTVHRYQSIAQSSKWQNAFRGFEGISIWKNVFGKQDPNTPDTSDDKWIEFGLLLLSYGILHDYTPNETDFRRAYFAVQPLRNDFALNTLVQWPRPKQDKKNMIDGYAGQSSYADNAQSLVLRLSRSLDALVERHASNPALTNHALDEYEESVCQLQVAQLPIETKTKTVFMLNLSNMIVRHAMLLTLSKKRKGWTWPTSLEEMDRFFDKIGYIVDGTFMSASTLREYLFSGNDSEGSTIRGKIVSNQNRSWLGNKCMTGRRGAIGGRSVALTMAGANCMGGGATNRWKKGSVDEVDHYDTARVVTDKRMLLAMSFGTSISPVVQTVYPNQFAKTLDESAKRYCQSHVHITDELSSTGRIVNVTLPSLFSWYRIDFGTYRENVLESIKHYLSVTDQDKVDEAQLSGKLRITFEVSSSAHWMCSFPKMEGLTEGDLCHPRLLLQEEVAPEQSYEVSNNKVVLPKKTLDPLRLRDNTENTVYSKGIETPKEKHTDLIQNISSVKEIVPGKRIYKRPSPLVNATLTVSPSKNIDMATHSASRDGITTSALLNPNIYLAHLAVTRNLLCEMGMEPSLCHSQDKSSLRDDRLLSTTRPENAARDIVMSGLGYPYRGSDDREGKHKPDKRSKFGETRAVHRKKSGQDAVQHDIQTGLFPDKLRNMPLQHSTNAESTHVNNKSMDVVQQWTGFTHLEPVIEQQTSQGDPVLMEALQVPSNARQASLGDSVLFPPAVRTRITASNTDPTKIEYFLPTENTDPNMYEANRPFDDVENGGQSFTFRSDLSAITFGSDFDLLRANSLSQLVYPATTSVAMMNKVRNLLQPPVTAPYGQHTYPHMQQQ